MVLDGSVSRSGQKCVRITKNGEDASCEVRRNVYPKNPFQTLLAVSAWSKTMDVHAPARAWLYSLYVTVYYLDRTCFRWYFTPFSQGTYDWEEKTTTITTESKPKSYFIVRVRLSNGNGTAQFDNVKLVEGGG